MVHLHLFVINFRFINSEDAIESFLCNFVISQSNRSPIGLISLSSQKSKSIRNDHSALFDLKHLPEIEQFFSFRIGLRERSLVSLSSSNFEPIEIKTGR